MRPDRIIVGECRSGEALDMLQAMTTGQDGSLSTGHANSPPDMLRRLETMVLMTGYELPLRAIREQIASAVDLIVHTARLKDGSRKIVNITEVYGIEDDEILTQDIFVFEQTGVKDGKIEGSLKPTGIRPTFMGKFKTSGITLPPGEFGIPPEDPAHPDASRQRKGRLGAGSASILPDPGQPAVGYGRAVTAGGMVYVSSIGPVDPETGRVGSGDDQGTDQAVPAQPEGQAGSRRELAREGRLGQLVAARPGGVRHVQRGVGPLVPRRCSDRPGHADARAATTRRVPGLHRGHRRGLGGRRTFSPAGCRSGRAGDGR